MRPLDLRAELAGGGHGGGQAEVDEDILSWLQSDGHADSHELDALQNIVGDAPQPSK